MKKQLESTTFKVSLLAISLALAIGLIGLVLYVDNDFIIKDISSLAATNRSINTYFAAIITAMVFIITLTSNLYSPHLIKVYVTHPITISGASYILLTNLVIVTTHLITKNHPWFQAMSFMSFSLTIIAMLGIIPYLYLISKFARPSYFIPLMSKEVCLNIDKLHKKTKKDKEKIVAHIFYQIDVINNMASTAIQRRDKTVLTIIYEELFHILNTFIIYNHQKSKDQTWRIKYSFFSHGTSEEGKYYLKRDRIWPETYILSKVLDNVNYLARIDNEIIPYVCRLMTHANEKCIQLEYKKLIRFNLMMLNTMIQEAIERKNQQKVSSIFYYYRINIELLSDQQELCEYALNNFIKYGQLALKKDEEHAIKNFLFDLSRIIHYLSFEGEDIAIKHYTQSIRPIWKEFIEHKKYESMTLKSIVKSFWNLYSQNYSDLTSDIREVFLKDNFKHAIILHEMLTNKGPIANEYSDNFINPEYLTGMAYSLANDFLSEFMDDIQQKKGA